MMKKIIVIGCPGAGKSFFSRELCKLTDIPVTHLDNIYWNKDRTHVSKDIFISGLRKVLDGDAWIIDGNYNSTMELRMSLCDTVFFFDLPTEVCLEGIKSRRGKPRSDLPWIEPEEEIDPDFILFVERYNTDTRPGVVELLEKYYQKNIIVFSSRKESQEYLNKLRK